MTQAKLAMESFDKDLDDTIKQFNEADMKDFWSSTYDEKGRGVKKMSGFNFTLIRLLIIVYQPKIRQQSLIKRLRLEIISKVSFLAQKSIPEQQTGIRAKGTSVG